VSRRRPLRWQTDSELVSAAGGGDREAATLLLERHYDRIAVISRRMMANRTDAEDATQQALIAVSRGLRSFDGRSAVSTWIHRVTVNACLDELRKSARRPVPVDPVDQAERGPAFEPDHAGAISDRDAIDHAMSQVAVEFRTAVVLRDVCGLDYHEIAAILDVPGGTVRSRISRGRRELRDLLGNQQGVGGVQGLEP